MSLRKSLCFVLMLCFSISFALADTEQNVLLSYLQQVFEFYLQTNDILTVDAAFEIIQSLQSKGYAVQLPLNRENEPILYPYDFSMKLLTMIWGEYDAWSIQQQYEFDRLMVDCGQISQLFHLLPSETEISEEDARRLALEAVRKKNKEIDEYGSYDMYISYVPINDQDTHGMWKISIDSEVLKYSYEVDIIDGNTYCLQKQKWSNLEDEFSNLESEKGFFFTWSLEEKMEFSQTLSDKVQKAIFEDQFLPSEEIFYSILNQSFCMPTKTSISADEALLIAIKATEDYYQLKPGWQNNYRISYSFFHSSPPSYTWRVIFYSFENDKKDDVYQGGYVEINAESKEVLVIEQNPVELNELIHLWRSL